MVLTRSDIVKELPCQEKFIMVDRACFDGPNKIIGWKSVSLGEWYFMGHFPGHPIMPGVLQVEAFAQLAELLCWKKLDPMRQGDIYIKAMNKIKFRKPNNPGDRIRFTVEMKAETSDSADFVCTAENNSGSSCQALITLAVRPRMGIPAPKMFNEFDKHDGILYDVNQISEIIPHRYPFLLVDYISKIEGDRVFGIKNACSDEAAFRCYADGYKVMSASVFPEIVAQAGCISVLVKPENKGKLAFFMAIDNAKCYKPVLPGDQLVCDVQIPDTKSRFGKGHGSMLVDGELAIESEIMFALVDA